MLDEDVNNHVIKEKKITCGTNFIARRQIRADTQARNEQVCKHLMDFYDELRKLTFVPFKDEIDIGLL